ncbi:hypothetical protein BDW72DRAFT_6454 [Aspergillus terricola var. indicus]
MGLFWGYDEFLHLALGTSRIPCSAEKFEKGYPCWRTTILAGLDRTLYRSRLELKFKDVLPPLDPHPDVLIVPINRYGGCLRDYEYVLLVTLQCESGQPSQMDWQKQKCRSSHERLEVAVNPLCCSVPCALLSCIHQRMCPNPAAAVQPIQPRPDLTLLTNVKHKAGVEAN